MNNEDISSVFEKLNIDKNSISPDMVNNFLNMLGNPKKDDTADTSTNHINYNQNNDNFYNEQNSNNTNNLNGSGIDMEMLLKMKSMMDKMNVKNDPGSNLLMSLKPYLKESRKDKLDQYVQLMSMSKMLDFLPFMGGDKKKND